MKTALSLAFLLLLSVCAFGQGQTDNWNDWWKSPQTRQAHALKLEQYFKALNDEIPTLSPAEERWLTTEYDDTIAANGGRFTTRAMNAMGTRSWSVRVAKPHAQQIESELALLSTQLDRTHEAQHWTRVAVLLMDIEFWESIDDLQKRGVIDKQRLQFLGGIHGPTATLWAQQILTEVVSPYFDTR